MMPGLQSINRGLEIRRTKNYIIFIVSQPASQNQTKPGNLFLEMLQHSYALEQKLQIWPKDNFCVKDVSVTVYMRVYPNLPMLQMDKSVKFHFLAYIVQILWHWTATVSELVHDKYVLIPKSDYYVKLIYSHLFWLFFINQR